MPNSPHSSQNQVGNHQLISTESPERSDDGQISNPPSYHSHPDFTSDTVVRIPRPDLIHEGESNEDCFERLRLEREIYYEDVTRLRNDQDWLVIKGDLDMFCAVLPALRNAKCDYEIAVWLKKGIEWYKVVLGDEEKRDRHLREAYDAYSANPNHQIELPYTNEVATFENQRGHRAFGELSRVNAFNSSVKQRIRNTKRFSPVRKVQPSVEHARQRLAELKEMDLEKHKEFGMRTRLEIMMIKNDIRAEQANFQPPSPDQVNRLRNEFKDLTGQLAGLYVGMGIPRQSIVSPAGERVKRPRASELRSLFVKMRKEFTDSGTMPAVEDRVQKFLVDFMFPAPPPPRVYLP